MKKSAEPKPWPNRIMPACQPWPSSIPPARQTWPSSLLPAITCLRSNLFLLSVSSALIPTNSRLSSPPAANRRHLPHPAHLELACALSKRHWTPAATKRAAAAARAPAASSVSEQQKQSSKRGERQQQVAEHRADATGPPAAL
eukprot:355657-Chlamydomonas_euryale.AAC.1